MIRESGLDPGRVEYQIPGGVKILRDPGPGS